MDFSKYPSMSDGDYPIVGAGEDIPLYVGPLDVIREGESYSGEGVLRWTWFPFPQVEYEVFCDQVDAGRIFYEDDFKVKIPDQADFSRTQEQKERTNDTFVVHSIGHMGSVVEGSEAGVEKVQFFVPNMLNVYGSPLTDGRGAWKGKIELHGGDWEVTLEARRDLNIQEKKIKKEGRYVVTHVGYLSRSDGYAMEDGEVTRALQLLKYCLSFGVGRYISPMLATGYLDGEIVWRDFRVPEISEWRATIPAIDTFNSSSLQEIFACFAKLWGDEFEREVLIRAVQYSMAANNPHPVEIATSIAQSALEMLAYEKFVEEEKKFKPGDFERRGAGLKIEELLDAMEIPNEITDQFEQLKEVSNHENCQGVLGPSVIAWMRQGVIHPSRNKVKHSARAWIEAWELIRHYLLLVVLRRIDYHGFYRSPTDQDPQTGKMDRVPWAVAKK
ncbi:hypothetical protein [Nocardiopsis lucentensis]|uniref:hypothetical protein n=1 Tax=Nocardiopsis lucentensis TaxID=53441 RepID=UPI0012694898|nr:hypothetical protein [Nocardiopsis lucentensis]